MGPTSRASLQLCFPYLRKLNLSVPRLKPKYTFFIRNLAYVRSFFKKWLSGASKWFLISKFVVLISASAIKSFMEFWRETWPNKSVTPKMHILEEHMVPFLKHWKLGCGFYGEQGGESVHRAFNTLHNTHASLNDQVKRLNSILKRHHLNVYPEMRNQDIRPVIKKRGPYKKAKIEII